MKKVICICCLMFCFLQINVLYAQLPDLPIIQDSLYSNILKETRTLEIVLPAGYTQASATNTSVIYTTDGEWNTRIIAEYSQFLGIQFIPPQIIVGIDHAPKGKGDLRFRDLTPSPDQNFPESGGGKLFLEFIQKELIPYINQKYPNKNVNTYFGASLGGLFGTYTLLTAPNLFNNYLLADPSLFWNNYEMQKLAGKTPPQTGTHTTCVLLTGRQGKAFRGMGIVGMDSILRANRQKDLNLKTLAYTDETHNSMIFRTIYDGLKFIYQGYYTSQNFGLHPAFGYIEKGDTIKLYPPDTALAEIHYTDNGTPPTRQSKRLREAVLKISEPAEYRFTSFANLPEYDTTISAHFKPGISLKAVDLSKNSRPGGLRYMIYDGINSLSSPKESGIADSSFNLQKTKYTGVFNCVMNGYFEAKTTGYYMFLFDYTGDIQFSLAGHVLLDHPSPGSATVLVPLRKGFYALRLNYYHNAGEKKLAFYYESPQNVAIDRAGPLPLELMYH